MTNQLTCYKCKALITDLENMKVWEMENFHYLCWLVYYDKIQKQNRSKLEELKCQS